MNAAAHCAKCHWYLSHAVPEFGEWVRSHLDGQHDELLRRAKTIVHRNQADKDQMLQQMRDVEAWMKQKRDSGHTGRLEFDAPWVLT